jgi:hypothetical protein
MRRMNVCRARHMGRHARERLDTVAHVLMVQDVDGVDALERHAVGIEHHDGSSAEAAHGLCWRALHEDGNLVVLDNLHMRRCSA